ncbi:hypothetical protein L202_07749 [Cryptococcus amylolentus CBS 6039]|uniref:FAD dependent oxidoreductase domain-containing protein n=1 Tax=Cryptococcus amylolentus CBS 6039 TaxID=1295533 RepID=A0A1E3HA16_9TREE|nr:hypothetical protein L202_07749 [Cryptococcus amylolentus CBS 6039]ODN73188.1 hypothetical protein L202_07749 [Cryptococcus amylolentus CBS 6039]
MVLPITNPTKSFWIEGTDSAFRNHRSTPDLPEKADIVIIGSGYAGTSTAYWIQKFAEKGQVPSIAILEARDVCGGATGRNGGQLRPHIYSRYPTWSSRFGPEGALALIRHEASHLAAFDALFEEEGIAEEVCFKLGETFDAAMSDEAWVRLKGAYEAFGKDFPEDDCFKSCRLIEDAKEAEAFTQMKGCIGAVVHPTGQVWPYKFVHAILRIIMSNGEVNLQSHTPVQKVSDRGSDGLITVSTDRGDVKAKAVVHATNRWASHLLPEFTNLIFPERCTVCAIKAPAGLIKHTGAQHWDSIVNNYHLQIPPPYNTIIVGGAKSALVAHPERYILSDEEDKQLEGVPEYYAIWPTKSVVGWEGEGPAEFERAVNEGGVWTGVETSSIDSFPFIGPVPNKPGQFVAAGFAGHGMPRILGSIAHLVPILLSSLKIPFTQPPVADIFPKLPEPFIVTEERVEKLQHVDAKAKFEQSIESTRESASKPWGKSWAVDV